MRISFYMLYIAANIRLSKRWQTLLNGLRKSLSEYFRPGIAFIFSLKVAES